MLDFSFLILLLLNLLISLAFFVLAMVYFFVEARDVTRSTRRKTFLIAALIFVMGVINAFMMRFALQFPKIGGYDLNSTYTFVVNILSAVASFFTTILYLRTGQAFSMRVSMPGSQLLYSKGEGEVSSSRSIQWKWIILPIPFLIVWTFAWFGIMPPEPTELALASTPEGDALSVYLYTFFTASILAPVTEEILYRHFAMGLLSRWFGNSKMAVVCNIGITSLIFAMAHAGVVTEDWIKIVQILPAGILFGWVNYKKGLAHSVLSHAAFNTLVVPVALLLEHFIA